MTKTTCDYMKCRRVADWVVETSYSPICLCTLHASPRYLAIAALTKSINSGSEFDLNTVETT